MRFLLTVLLASMLSTPALAGAPRFAVQISGTPGVPFSGTCRIEDPQGGWKERALEGAVPQDYRFDASGLSCSLRKIGQRGTLRVRVLDHGRVRSVSRTSGPAAVLSFSVR